MGINDEKVYYHQNQQYSVVGLTDSNGSVLERYAYTAYGKPTILAANGLTELDRSVYFNRYLFTGREWNSVNNLYYFRSRMYDPEDGRFLSRDPIGYEGSPWNLYEFVNGRTLIGLDPHGHWGWFPGGVPSHEGSTPSYEQTPPRPRPPQPPTVHPGIDGDYVYVESDWPRYWPFWNEIGLPKNYFDEDGTIKCQDQLSCLQEANVANETWHAWWDQVLEERSNCQWLYDMIKDEAEELYGSGGSALEMAEEAMSESASSWTLYTCNGRAPTYENSASPPAHNSPGDVWEGEELADKKISQKLYSLLEHALRYGCNGGGNFPDPHGR